jgi:GTP-binding protein HflX
LSKERRIDLSVKQEKALLVGVILPDSQVDPRDPLGELESLAGAAGARVVDKVIQNRSRPAPAFYIGKGKAEEIATRAEATGAEVVIFDNDLSPAQIRELEEVIKRKVIDRSELILDIFATRAQTKQARLQVELAQLEYTAPRLRGMWTHLERVAGMGGAGQAGAVGGIGTRGPGERQIEIDRRIVSKRVTALKRNIKEVEERKQREVFSRRDWFTVSIVGYTNAGKSTLMNALTDAGVLVEDKLFATLDTRTRRWNLGDGFVAMLSDTVGFVRDIPHHLVASFHATLEEALSADLLLHVVDASSPVADLQIEAVEKVLASLKCQDKATILVLNKVDQVTDDASLHLLQRLKANTVSLSAKNGIGVDKLVEAVKDEIRRQHRVVQLEVDPADSELISWLSAHAKIMDQTSYDDRYVMKIAMTNHRYDQLHKLRPGITERLPTPAHGGY